MVNNVGMYWTWLLDVPLTQEEWYELANAMQVMWPSSAQAMLPDVQRWSQEAAAVPGMTPADSAARRAQDYHLEFDNMQANYDGPPLQRWVITVWQRGNDPIATADGVPPLTRQDTDAYAELSAFFFQQIEGSVPFDTDPITLDKFAGLIAGEYAQLPAEVQIEFVSAPKFWRQIRGAWPTRTKEQKQNLTNVFAVLVPWGKAIFPPVYRFSTVQVQPLPAPGGRYPGDLDEVRLGLWTQISATLS